MKTIKQLQQRVNEITRELGGIETMPKLREAKRLARQDESIQGLLLDILDDALTLQWREDLNKSVAAFFDSVMGA